MPAAPFHARIAEMPRESIAGGVLTRTAVRTDDAIVTFNWIEPSHPQVPPHSHPHDQLALFVPQPPNKALERLRAVDVNSLTPLAALQLVAELSEQANT